MINLQNSLLNYCVMIEEHLMQHLLTMLKIRISDNNTTV